MPNGKDIVDVMVGEWGAKSESNLSRERSQEFGKNQKYRGEQADVGESAIETPHKKPTNQEMSEKKNEEKRLKSRPRIVVEHLIRLLKIYRVASEKFR